MDKVIDIFIYHSPVGDLVLGATSSNLVLCDWPDAEGNPRPEVAKRLKKYGIDITQATVQSSSAALLDRSVQSGNAALLKEAESQLSEYFQGARQKFNLPIQTFGTPFQQQVWQQLQTIPYGTTLTYKQQAIALNMPKAIRAVANANRLNPISIIIPCHRVLGTQNKLSALTPPIGSAACQQQELSTKVLTGYAGGLDRKLWLLNHEQQHSSDKKIDK